MNNDRRRMARLIGVPEKYRQAMFRALEWEVKLYPETKARLELLRDDIIEAGHVSDGTGRRAAGTTSDVTSCKAVRLLTSYQIAETQRRVKAIDRAIAQWTAKDKKARESFIRMLFWNQLTEMDVAVRVGIGSRTVRRWRRELLLLVANYLGWTV